MNNKKEIENNELTDEVLSEAIGGSFSNLSSLHFRIRPDQVNENHNSVQSIFSQPGSEPASSYVPTAKPVEAREPMYIPTRRKVKPEELL